MPVFRKFWMVMGHTTKHESEQSARLRAEKLASEHPDCEFYVLEAVGKCTKADVAWASPTESDDVPFLW